MSALRPRRATKRPDRLEVGGDDAALRMAIEASLAISQQPVASMSRAPVFRPTKEEWSQPLEYLQSVMPRCEAQGICKIVPPAGWRPHDRFTGSRAVFETKRQEVHRLQEGRAFGQGASYTLREYEAYSTDSEREFMASQLYTEVLDEVKELGYKRGRPQREKALERCYWRVVQHAAREVSVDYGSDIIMDTFPMKKEQRRRARDEDEGQCCGQSSSSEPSAAGRAAVPWELSSLVYKPKSLLKNLPEHIDGVTRPWVYVGTLFASFCWHTEDHYLPSINYMHQGAPKTWYGVSSANAGSFEDACRKNVPELIKNEPDVLYKLTLALPPELCLQFGVPLVHTVQHPGEIIVTLPRAYHSGFSHGFNIGEAVNFATCDWLRWGRAALTDNARRRSRRPPLFSQDLMTYKLAKSLLMDHTAGLIKCAVRSAADIRNLIVDLEKVARDEEYHWAKLTRGPDVAKALAAASSAEPGDGQREAAADPPSAAKRRRLSLLSEVYTGVPTYVDMLDLHTACEICNCLPFFSEVRCSAQPAKRACPGCSHSFRPFAGTTKYLKVLMGAEEIRELLRDVQRVLDERAGASVGASKHEDGRE